jgi:hypothetical protein
VSAGCLAVGLEVEDEPADCHDDKGGGPSDDDKIKEEHLLLTTWLGRLLRTPLAARLLLTACCWECGASAGAGTRESKAGGGESSEGDRRLPMS